jgi:chromosome segregation ATPase
MVVGAILHRDGYVFMSKLMELNEETKNILMPFIEEIISALDVPADVHELRKSMNKQILEIERLNELLQEALLDKENLETDIFNLRERIKEFEGESKQLDRLPSFLNVSSLEFKLAKTESRLEAKTEEYEKLRKDYISEKETLQNQLDNLKDISKDYKRLLTEVETLRKKSDELQKLKLDHSKLIQTNQNNLDRLRVYEKEAQSIILEVQSMRSLKEELEELKRVVQTSSFKIEEQKKEILNLCKQKQEADSSRDYYKKEVKRLEESKNFSRQPTTSLANELSSLDDDLRVDFEQEQEKMKKLLFTGGIIAGLQSQVDAVVKEKVLISAELQNMTICKNTLESEIAHLNLMMQENSKNNSAKIERFEAKVKILENANFELKNELVYAQNSFNETSKRLMELIVLEEEMKEVYKGKQKIYEQLEKVNFEKDEIFKKLSLTSRELQKLQENFEKLQKKYLETKQNLKISKESIEKLLDTSNQNEIQQRETYYKEEIQKLSKTIDEKNQEIENLSTQRQNIETITDKAKVEKENFDKESEDLRKIIQEETEKNKNLENERISLKNA